jgi:hypothetical protein
MKMKIKTLKKFLKDPNIVWLGLAWLEENELKTNLIK